MSDKQDPAFEQPPAPEPSEPVRRAAPEPVRARSQIPEEPEAFRRWIEIEKLKVDRKRLEYEGLRAEGARAEVIPETSHPVEPPPRSRGFVGAATLVIMVLLAAGMGYLAVQASMLQRELVQLRAGQVELTEAVQTLASLPRPSENAQPAPSSWSPNLGTLAQPESPPPAPESAPPAADPAAVVPTPVPVTTVTPPPPEALAQAQPAAPALMGTGYTVKIYAPTPGPNKKRLENFMSLLKTSGFTVDVSDSSVTQSLNNSIAYHASEVAMANKVASLLQAKYPALDFELRASASIPEGAKRLFIMNLTEDAVN